MSARVDRVAEAYRAFNARDVDAALDVMTEDVDWPNAWEGGRVIGRDAVRDYWKRQWGEIDSTATPVEISEREDGAVEVEVHQVVRAKDGSLLSDGRVRHVFVFDGELVSRMDVEDSPAGDEIRGARTVIGAMNASEDAPRDELRRLDAFVGTWDISMHVSGRLGEEGAATTSFEWLEGGRFLIQRSRADDPFPDGISIIGWDAERNGCLLHYFDSRGVARVYDLTFDGSTLEMSRPYVEGDFAQRFSGRLSDDGTRLDGRWEFSDDGADWELDFELTYDRTT